MIDREMFCVFMYIKFNRKDEFKKFCEEREEWESLLRLGENLYKLECAILKDERIIIIEKYKDEESYNNFYKKNKLKKWKRKLERMDICIKKKYYMIH